MSAFTGESTAAVAAERSRVAVQGWGARLLAAQGSHGAWGEGVSAPPWFATLYTLQVLREMGLDAASDPARVAIGQVRDKVTWGAEFHHAPFFAGESETCINGGVLALAAYFGVGGNALADRLLAEQLDDGGWNCEAPKSRRSSLHTTICVLEGLLEFEKSPSATTAHAQARLRGEEYLLARQMYRRLSTGEVIDPGWARFAFPCTWRYDILRGLDYVRRAGVAPGPRTAEAVDLVRAARNPDGQWLRHDPQLDPPRWWRYPLPFPMDAGNGQPSRWNTLRALRVLRWHGNSVL